MDENIENIVETPPDLSRKRIQQKSSWKCNQKKVSRIKTNAAFLCNFEVMQILQQLKDNTQKKHKREGSLATVTYETIHYLQNSDCKSQTAESIEKFLEAMKPFRLTKSEKLMMLNTPPRTELEIQLIVQESEERLTEEEVSKIISIANEFLPASDNS